MSRRPVEAAYVRLVLDPGFAARLAVDDAFAAQLGLTTTERDDLRQICGPALAVERRGRWRSLWARVAVQLPATAARLRARRGEAGMTALWHAYFSGEFWALDQTLDVPPHGPGMEMASTVRLLLRRLAEQEPGPASALERDLCELEYHRFRVRVLADGPAAGGSEFDLELALRGPQLAAQDLLAAEPVLWDISATGALRFTRAGAQPVALTLAPALLVCLDSNRLNRYHTASTLYFTLGDQAAEINAAHAALLARPSATSPWFVPDGAGWRLRPEVYFRPTPSLLDSQTHLGFVARTGGATRARLAVDRATLATLGAVLPRLRASLSRDEIFAGLDPAGRALLARLLAAGLVVERPLQPRRRPRDFGVTLVGHACLALESPGTRVLIDPLLTIRNRPEVDAAAILDAGVDAIVISHCHWDHLNFDTLLQIDRRATVIVPRMRHPTSITNLDMARLCAELGFTRVVALEPWQSTTVGDIVLTALPYHGENNGEAGVHDWITYHAALGGRSVCGLVDACRDASGDMDAVMHTVRQQLGAVDVLFAPCSAFHYPISNYTRRPFFAGAGREQYTGGPDDVARWAAIAGAGVVVPYALFHLLPGDADGDAAAVAMDEFRSGGLAELRARLAAPPAGPLCALRPGDRLGWTIGGPVRWQRDAAPPEVRR